MPNGVIAHEPSGQFDLEKLKAEAKAWPGLRRHGPRAGSDLGPELYLGRDALGLGRGLRTAGRTRTCTSWPSTTASSATSCAAWRRRAAR